MISKHFTAFSRQVREGVIIDKMSSGNDIILNSKREIVGNRIIRKKIDLNGEAVEILNGDISKLGHRKENSWLSWRKVEMTT